MMLSFVSGALTHMPMELDAENARYCASLAFITRYIGQHMTTTTG